ncbi:EAL domain-containing protein [Bacillus sp. M6-12]|uniref:EAL domain-containing protein n=1 Tax=Bacillus sp. M6-12 TaxID=2054166 RepID=UPI000C773103|nr:EAL domain-containing protein [Bacillus sp. M6-12]PLS18087.1 EAL domain-containing protein [Bacillus sp. M6-12]
MAHNNDNIHGFLDKWLRFFYPDTKIRFYPPQFIIRNPMVSSVKKAVNEGFEVAVIAYHLKNMRELAENLGNNSYNQYIRNLKSFFMEVVKSTVPEDDILIVHDYYSDGLTLLLKVNPNKQQLAELDGLTSKVAEDTVKQLKTLFPGLAPVLQPGYMFIEKKHYSLEGALNKAHHQAVAMAEKRVHSGFNQMLYSMNKIVAGRNIRLLAQPIFDVATREIRAYEVLTRGPAGTELESPLTLFSVARQTNMLYELELIVVQKTLEQISLNGSAQNVFINLTPITVGSQRFLEDLKKVLSLYPEVSPRQIVIELTERDSFEDIELLSVNIKMLRQMGFRIAIDDTGAGYASLHTISEIMPDIIKIDRSVIQNIDSNSVKESMLKGLLLIANEAGAAVVAEGIESEKEAMVLSRNKVDLAQGYYYAKPAKIEKIRKSWHMERTS